MIHISEVVNKPETMEYWRKPTKAEIKFGYGALHYRDFKFKNCFDENGYLKLKCRATDDGQIYYCASDEFSTSQTNVTHKIQ